MPSGDPPTSTPTLVEHFFRHESGRLIALLTRRFGAERLPAIEDAVQVTFERALGAWPRTGTPDSPAAWLTRVAVNQMLDRLRREKHRSVVPEARNEAPISTESPPEEDILVMLFACADERLAPRARLVLCLKLLCGFSTKEIAGRLFMTEANVQKTLERGRKQLRERWHDVDALPPTTDASDTRLSTVQRVLYLLFNEGSSLAGSVGLRTELCEEAIRLTNILATHPVGDRPSTWALLALMHFHAARLPARLDADGALIPLPEQNRQQWDRNHIQDGFKCMGRATLQDVFSRYHGEAAIQIEHTIAPSYRATRWTEIIALYEALEAMQPSPVYALNRIIALAEHAGPKAALDSLDAHPFPQWFQRHYLLIAARGELHRRLEQMTAARALLEEARELAPSQAEQRLFSRRIHACDPSSNLSPEGSYMLDPD